MTQRWQLMASLLRCRLSTLTSGQITQARACGTQTGCPARVLVPQQGYCCGGWPMGHRLGAEMAESLPQPGRSRRVDRLTPARSSCNSARVRFSAAKIKRGRDRLESVEADDALAILSQLTGSRPCGRAGAVVDNLGFVRRVTLRTTSLSQVAYGATAFRPVILI